MSARRDVVVYRCPMHPQFWSLVIENPGGGGTRIFGGKCCPSQYGEQIRWSITDEKAEELVYELEGLKP